MTTKIETVEPSALVAQPSAQFQSSNSGDLIAFARSAEEMQQGQSELIAWSAGKLAEARQHLDHMSANLEQAKTYSWALNGFRSAVNEARKKLEYYEKLHAAFSAGYCVVPDFPIDIFAVRTARVAPKMDMVQRDYHWGDIDRRNQSENLPLGCGEYVSDQPLVMERKFTVEETPENKKTKYEFWTESFRHVDFPIKTAAITVLDATGRAMAARIFDEIGILPARRQKNVDPMVIGRINYKHSGRERTVSFVIAWFLRESDLTV